MLFFANDYGCGAHPDILKRLIETNEEALPGYGSDKYTKSATEKIKQAAHLPDTACVYFMAGGTQTNMVVISYYLRPWEGVLSADTAHIAVHEAGAIEHSGHKVLTLPSKEGKITASAIDTWIRRFYADDNHEHMTAPGMVYISFPTEYGTLYTKDELTAIYEVCQTHNIPLYIDGARLAYGLASETSDVTLPFLASHCAVFYIGGTKTGALIGEAIVFPKGMPDHFLTFAKEKGALLAKGRLVALQFDTLFTNDLYKIYASHAVGLAMLLKDGLRAKGYEFYVDSPTNQQFLVLSEETYKKLTSFADVSLWEILPGGKYVVRLATSWATSAADVRALLTLM